MSDDHIQDQIARDQYAMTDDASTSDEQAVARAICGVDEGDFDNPMEQARALLETP